MSDINYANYFGIHKSELAGAIIFTAIYAPLFVYNVLRSIRHPTYVLVMLAFFCLLRVVAFVLRAILAGSSSADGNLNLLVAEQVIYSTGFFGLLYSAYTLVLDRELIVLGPKERNMPGPLGLVARVMRNRHLIRIALIAAVALGITAGVDSASSDPDTLNTAQTLRRASTYIFLVVSIMLVIVTARLAVEEDRESHSGDDIESIGRKYRLVLLLAIALLCVVREAFFTATAKNQSKQNNAHLWYPLSALPELIAVLIFAVPGLVPSRAEIAKDLEIKFGTEGHPSAQWGFGRFGRTRDVNEMETLHQSR